MNGIIASAAAASTRAQQSSPSLSTGEHELKVSDVRLWYRVAGRQGGVPVIFLHGGPGQGSQVFQAFGGPQLERTQRLVYLDQRGAGRSDRPSNLSKYSMDIMVEDVEQLRRHLGVPRMALLAHSFGTRLALEYAARYPQHTAAVVLAAAATNLLRSLDLQCQRLAKDDPAAYARATQGVQASAFPRCDTRRAYPGEEGRAFALRNLFPDPAMVPVVDRLESVNGGNTGEASRALFQQGYMQYRFTRAAQVRAPVLVIAGGRDFQAALEVQQDLVKELPRGRLLIYPANGHFMFVEDPARFARDVAEFLRRVRP
jgi:proline iminopeptidase